MLNNSTINLITNWGKNDENIRAIVLEGSQGKDIVDLAKKLDKFSDYDINIFVSDKEKYLINDSWIYNFDDVLIYQKADFSFNSQKIPSRLVIYKNIPRIDFSFWDIKSFDNLDENNIYEPYKNGFYIILDKDNILKKLPKQKNAGFIIKKPTEEIFLSNIYDFLFELAITVKYLKRESLFFAKLLENRYLKDFLLEMISWDFGYKNNWASNKLHTEGKNLEFIADLEIKNKLNMFFSGYNTKETYESLIFMLEFYQEISEKLAFNLNYKYPKNKFLELKNYLNTSFYK
ncbi:MAG: aminoglycoside 6-adenylyltransferase [Candidatus Sericytochromatia bacterium]